MRIIFDLDGTITDFNCFIEKIALPYFKRKYRLDIVNLDKLEIEDILNMQPIFKKNNSPFMPAMLVGKLS